MAATKGAVLIVDDLSAIKRLFGTEKVREIALEGGRSLYRPGDPASHLYRVRSGGLAVFRAGGDGSQMVGVVRPGEIVGEASLLTGDRRGARVVALRDSMIEEMAAADFFAAARRDPDVLIEITRLLVARARTAGQAVERPRLIGLQSLSPRLSARDWAERCAAAIRAEGEACAIVTPDELAQRLDDLAAGGGYALCPVEAGAAEVAATCARQVDRLLLFGSATEAPPPPADLPQSGWLAQSGLIDLVLVRGEGKATGTGKWLDAVHPARHFQFGARDDCGRLARVLTGRSVGLALSGGGARAFAHVGAVETLRQAGVPLDSLCGTSMGAIVAAGVALGWDREEMDRRMRAAFVTSNPLDDISLPLVAMTRGCKVEARLTEHFGSDDIADMPLPYFCLSADLGSGETVVHRRGCLTTALRASIALPGVLPPVTVGEQVLVDGGVLRNLPTATLRADHDGTVVAVDVSHAVGLRPGDVERPRPLLRWFRSGDWRRGPPIVSILMRSATLASGPDLLASKRAADLYVMPDVDGIEIRNWRAYDRAVAAGRVAMDEALRALDVPVSELRRSRLETAISGPM